MILTPLDLVSAWIDDGARRLCSEPASLDRDQPERREPLRRASTHPHILPAMITAGTLRREQVLGHARLDFLINDTTYIEVKTPLDNLQVTLASHIQTRPHPPLDSTERLVRHISELCDSLAGHQRAILLICFLYDNPGFRVYRSRHHATVKARVSRAIQQGVEIWQVNCRLDRTGVQVLSHHELTRQFSA